MSPAISAEGAPRFYPGDGSGIARSLLRQTGGVDRRAGCPRGAQAAAAGGGGQWPRRRRRGCASLSWCLALIRLIRSPRRVMGPDPHALLDIAERVKSVLQASPLMRTVNTDWGSRVPVMHFSLNQDRLQASGLSSQSVAQQLQFLLSGIPITTVREDIRAVQVIGRAAGDIRLDPAKIADFTLGGQRRAAGSLVTDWRRVDQDGGPAASPSRPHADHHRPRRCCGEPAAAGCLHRADEAAAAHYRLAAAPAIASRRRGRLRNPARPPGRWCRYFR